MVPQIYCSKDDLEAAWTPAALLAAVDDDSSGVLSPSEIAILDRAMERAANRMNASLLVRYMAAELMGNAWCRDCNAAIATYLLATRHGAAAPDQIQEQYEAYLEDIEEIRAGRKCVPGAIVILEHGPTTTNFRIDGRNEFDPIQRVPETSTGPAPRVALPAN